MNTNTNTTKNTNAKFLKGGKLWMEFEIQIQWTQVQTRDIEMVRKAVNQNAYIKSRWPLSLTVQCPLEFAPTNTNTGKRGDSISWHLQSGASSQAKHGGAYFLAIYGSIEDPMTVWEPRTPIFSWHCSSSYFVYNFSKTPCFPLMWVLVFQMDFSFWGPTVFVREQIHVNQRDKSDHPHQ